MGYSNILEEEIKNRVTQDFFQNFDCTRILGKIDFAVKSPAFGDLDGAYLLWAEAKQKSTDIIAMLTQLVLTIGKARTFDEILPPPFLGCYDSEKIAFVPYSDIQDIFYQNDFNWKIAPSDTETREFKQIYKQIEKIISPSPTHEEEGLAEALVFDFVKDEKELKCFISENFIIGKTETSKIRIDKNNFITIYIKWLEAVKPYIGVNWDAAKKINIIDGDFYLADLLSINNETIKEKLFVLLKSNIYKYNRQTDALGEIFREAYFSDNQKKHAQFWAKYERPPLEEYWDYIINRRDLLVPQDVRERKGSFYTPRIWVELSQRYLAEVLGENWQDEYYVWDCAAGTGNLLAGLTNKYNIWASTLDSADVDVMKDRIQNGANLLESHVFQFDFLNDNFSKLPQGLQDIINDPKRCKKLVVYINPPYAEASNRQTIISKGENKSKVSTTSNVYNDFQSIAGTATRELFAQFFLRIYRDIPDCKLATFSTLKYVSAQYFYKFRNYFKAEFKKGFICKANSFDNVNGNFPICFSVLDLAVKNDISKIKVDVFDNDKEVNRSFFIGKKAFYSYPKGAFIIDWLKKHYDKKGGLIAYLRMQGTDVQNNLGVFITNKLSENDIIKHLYTLVTQRNLIEISVYYSARKVIPATWLNDRDQFLFPNNKWEKDTEFQNNCLTYALFNNNIQSKYGANHWIPFTETEINASDKFESHFMMSFIGGKLIQNGYSNLFEQEEGKLCEKREFSTEATNVFNAGRELWRYYHAQKDCNVNASLYDIREYFQGRNNMGKMNNKSDNENYNELINDLRSALKILAKKIEPKIYEYGFLNR